MAFDIRTARLACDAVEADACVHFSFYCLGSWCEDEGEEERAFSPTLLSDDSCTLLPNHSPSPYTTTRHNTTLLEALLTYYSLLNTNKQ